MPSTSPKLNPSSRSITSIRRVTSVGWGRGTTKSRWSSAAKVMAISSMLSASRRKSSSSMIVSANSSTRAGGLASAATGMRPTRCGASHAITARSWRTRRDRGALDLHHHRRPVAQRGRVHLGDGGGGQRGVVHGGEHRPDGPAQLFEEHALDDRPRLGGDLVAAPLELGDQLGREDAVARGDDLAQLDVGRAELLGRDAQPARDPGDRGRAAAPALLQRPQPQGAAEVPHRGADPTAGRQRAATGQAGERGSEARPHPGQAVVPLQGRGVDRPRAGVGERTERGIGVRHDPSLRVAGGGSTTRSRSSVLRSPSSVLRANGLAFPEP